jgi:tetratricopeptide (TPR) repeat protein
MDIKKEIKSLLQQADVYREQGLLNEAKEKYVLAGKLVKKNEQQIKNKSVLSHIMKKIKTINEEINKVESAPVQSYISEDVQNIIKEKFAFSKDKDTSELEGAIALAKFGQFERALKEFNQLIETESIRVDAAKNIIRCHMALDTIEEFIPQYEQWAKRKDMFTPEQLNKLRVFLQNIIDKKGIDKTLPKVEAPKRMEASISAETEEEKIAESMEALADEYMEEQEIDESAILDISYIGIKMEEGPNAGQIVEYDVSFQSGSEINLIISNEDKELLESLQNGMMLSDVQFYSPIAMFNGKAMVVNKTMIEAGPKQGHYSLDLKIKSI